jgi:ERF superfamily
VSESQSTERVTVYERLQRVFDDVPAIAKNLRNVESGYAARSIDDIYDALHGLFAEHGVRPSPQVVDHTYEWLTAKSGTQLLQVFETVELYFESVDGERTVEPIRLVGEGRDAADKASNKALSAAMKYALIHTFLIPVTGESDDPDSTSVEAGTNESPELFRRRVNAAKKRTLEAANDDRALAAAAWADALATYGIVDETEIQTTGGAELVAELAEHASSYIEESANVEKSTPDTKPDPL